MLIYASPGRVAVTPWGVIGGVTVGTHNPGPSAPGPFSMFGTLTGLAGLIAVLVGAGMALGYFLDSLLSTPHVFLFVGLAARHRRGRPRHPIDRHEVLPMTNPPLTDRQIDYKLALRSAARNYNRTLILAAAVGVAGFLVLALTVSFSAGVLFAVGIGLGVVNSQLVQRSLVTAVTNGDTDRKQIGFGVLKRLSVVTVFAFLIALAYQPNGWIVFIGLTTFQFLITVTLFGGLARQVRRA